jgi:hypothetical protein
MHTPQHDVVYTAVNHVMMLCMVPAVAAVQVSMAPVPGAHAAAGGQLPALDTDASTLGGDPASAAVSTHAGPEADPYHLAA